MPNNEVYFILNGTVLVPKTISTSRVYEGQIINLRLDTLQIDNSNTATREIVEHRGAVVILPVTPNRTVLLVRQWRQAAGKILLEAPAGTIEPGEIPELTAQRELQEEVGYSATNLRALGAFYTAPGFCNEFIHAYVATELPRSILPQDADEDVHVEETALADVPSLISSGAIVDAKTIAASLMMLCSANELL